MKVKKLIFISVILILSIVTISMQSISGGKISTKSFPVDDYVYDVVDEMPQFPGGKEGLEKYVKDNLVYPRRVKRAGIFGKVYTEFIVETDGEITSEKVYEGVSRKLESEALKIVKNMPHWIPGKHEDKKVRVKIILPINYELKQ